jgi:hypothetical protein
MKQTFAIGIGGAAGQGEATPGDIFAKGNAVVTENIGIARTGDYSLPKHRCRLPTG